jgi:hypothetical protein
MHDISQFWASRGQRSESQVKTTPWIGAGFDAWLLAFEATGVITLRMMKLAAGGPEANREARRMVSEKIAASTDLWMRAMTGGLGSTAHGVTTRTLAHYRPKVRANRRRLSKT